MLNVAMFVHIQKNLLISKSFIMFKSSCVSPSYQECGLFFWACISTPALQTLGWLGSSPTHRADCKQARGCVSQAAVKTPNGTPILNASRSR